MSKPRNILTVAEYVAATASPSDDISIRFRSAGCIYEIGIRFDADLGRAVGYCNQEPTADNPDADKATWTYQDTDPWQVASKLWQDTDHFSALVALCKA